MARHTFAIWIALIIFSAVCDLQAEPYDLIVRHGKVIDGTGNAWFYADVGVRQGRVVAIGDLAKDTAASEIDATGLIVAPGFIDVHTHADEGLFSHPEAENFIRDGVTTIITGNCGGSPSNVAAYFDRLQRKGTAVNVGVLFGHNTVLREVKGDRAGDLTPEQMTRAKSLVATAMQAGAVGMSTGLIYRPGTYSKTEEIIELQKVAASYGGIYATHMRSEGAGVLKAIDEALRIGREANCRAEISHFKISADSAAAVGGSDATLAKVLAARARGQEVWLDQYPYDASSTSISTMLPDEYLADGEAKARDRLKDPKVLDQLVEQMRRSYEQRGRKDLSHVMIASCSQSPQYEGRSLVQVAQAMKPTPTDRELLVADPKALKAELLQVSLADQCRAAVMIWKEGGASCVFHSMAEPDVEKIMACPLVSIASDSGVRQFGVGVPHPRGYGTNARVLGVYARERKRISLEEAVRKMTSQPATAFRLKDRGQIRENSFADLTIFNADTVVDKATFEKPHQFPDGIEYVVVNGKVVCANGKMTGTLSGQNLYGPGKSPATRPDESR